MSAQYFDHPPEIKEALKFMIGAEEGRRTNRGLIAEQCFERSFQAKCRIVVEYLSALGVNSVSPEWCKNVGRRDQLLTYLTFLGL